MRWTSCLLIPTGICKAGRHLPGRATVESRSYASGNQDQNGAVGWLTEQERGSPRSFIGSGPSRPPRSERSPAIVPGFAFLITGQTLQPLSQQGLIAVNVVLAVSSLKLRPATWRQPALIHLRHE